MTKNIGKILQQARKEQGLGLQAISNKLFIRVHYLEAIEDNDLHLIPSKPQLLGFIRAYADFLGLDPIELISSIEDKPEIDNEIPELEIEDKSPKTVNHLKTQQIYLEIGKKLKENREKLGISLEDISSLTHINLNNLQSIEKGELDQFSSAAQARGMLRNYSDFLGLETDRLLVRFAEALQSKIGIVVKEVYEEETENEVETKDGRPTIKLREIFSLDMAVFGIVGVLIIFFLIWGVGRVMRIQSEIGPEVTATVVAEIEPTESSEIIIVDNSTEGPQSTELQNDDNETIEDAPIIQIGTGDSLTINVIASIRTYLKVIVDGQVKFDGRTIAGSNIAFSAQDTIEVITGNGAGIEVIYNGTQLGPMGIFGEAVQVIYTKEGQLTPTPIPIEATEIPNTLE